MRNAFCQSLVKAAAIGNFVFLTGDLGYKALEPLRDALGPRFFNMGVAEQNMVGVSAGLAKQGVAPWVYSIAPFAYARPFEQIRNDICLHKLPVVIVGNGGGFGYGVMGGTHHAIEDYGSILCLQNIRAYIPAFDKDVEELTEHLFTVKSPAYLRLGLSEQPASATPLTYAPWRKLLDGPNGVLAGVGPLIGGMWDYALQLPQSQRPTIWLISELPITEPPAEFIEDVCRSQRLLTIEEHVAQGGFGRMLAGWLLEHGIAPAQFAIAAAAGYVSGRYGSQKFHRQECGLDPVSVFARLNREHLSSNPSA